MRVEKFAAQSASFISLAHDRFVSVRTKKKEGGRRKEMQQI
jgi:hypothetical protein